MNYRVASVYVTGKKRVHQTTLEHIVGKYNRHVDRSYLAVIWAVRKSFCVFNILINHRRMFSCPSSALNNISEHQRRKMYQITKRRRAKP